MSNGKQTTRNETPQLAFQSQPPLYVTINLTGRDNQGLSCKNIPEKYSISPDTLPTIAISLFSDDIPKRFGFTPGSLNAVIESGINEGLQSIFEASKASKPKFYKKEYQGFSFSSKYSRGDYDFGMQVYGILINDDAFMERLQNAYEKMFGKVDFNNQDSKDSYEGFVKKYTASVALILIQYARNFSNTTETLTPSLNNEVMGVCAGASCVAFNIIDKISELSESIQANIDKKILPVLKTTGFSARAKTPPSNVLDAVKNVSKLSFADARNEYEKRFGSGSYAALETEIMPKIFDVLNRFLGNIIVPVQKQLFAQNIEGFFTDKRTGEIKKEQERTQDWIDKYGPKHA